MKLGERLVDELRISPLSNYTYLAEVLATKMSEEMQKPARE